MTRAIVLVIALAGCVRSIGTVGLAADDADVVGTKLLHPGLEGRSCRTSVLGIPLRAGTPDAREALEQILARDTEGNVVTHVSVATRTLLTGVYNRRCIELRGDLARATSRLTLPAIPGHAHGEP